MGRRNPTQLTGPLEKDNKLIITDALSSAVLGSSIVNPVLALIHTTRIQLLKHQIYREPFLKCLHSLYKPRQGHNPDQLSHLNDIRPTKPTDADVRNFILHHWPEVSLKKRQEYMPRSLIDAGHVRPLDDAIHLNRGLAALLVAKTMEKLCAETEIETSEPISLAEVKVACISILLYEFGRLLVSWWSRPGFQTKGRLGGAKPRPSGARNGSKTNKQKKRRPRLLTARNLLDRWYMWYTQHGGWCVQTSFFGGLVECWTPDRCFGELAEMKGIGIEWKPSKGPEATKGMLDEQTAAAVVQKFTTNAVNANALPLLDPRKLISPFESYLNGVAPRPKYWNMAINGKLRSAQVYLPRAATFPCKSRIFFHPPPEYHNTWNERDDDDL